MKAHGCTIEAASASSASSAVYAARARVRDDLATMDKREALSEIADMVSFGAPARLGSLRVRQLLGWAPGVGATTIGELMHAADLRYEVRLRALTPARRERLVEAIEDYCAPVREARWLPAGSLADALARLVAQGRTYPEMAARCGYHSKRGGRAGDGQRLSRIRNQQYVQAVATERIAEALDIPLDEVGL